MLQKSLQNFWTWMTIRIVLANGNDGLTRLDGLQKFITGGIFGTVMRNLQKISASILATAEKQTVLHAGKITREKKATVSNCQFCHHACQILSQA